MFEIIATSAIFSLFTGLITYFLTVKHMNYEIKKLKKKLKKQEKTISTINSETKEISDIKTAYKSVYIPKAIREHILDLISEVSPPVSGSNVVQLKK